MSDHGQQESNERRTRITVRLEVLPHIGTGRIDEKTLCFDIPMSREDELKRMEGLIAEMARAMWKFYDLTRDRA